MSLSKAVPDGLRNSECERTALHEHPPVPYIPQKDEVQEMVPSMKSLQLKTSIGEDTTLHFPIWNIGIKEAMLMHVIVTLDAIKKHGQFQDYETAQVLYMAKKEVAKQGKAGLSLLYGVSNVTEKSKKLSRKIKEAIAVTKASDQEIEANFQADLKMAKEATENTKDTMTAAANKMFAFYANFALGRGKICMGQVC